MASALKVVVIIVFLIRESIDLIPNYENNIVKNTKFALPIQFW